MVVGRIHRRTRDLRRADDVRLRVAGVRAIVHDDLLDVDHESWRRFALSNSVEARRAIDAGLPRAVLRGCRHHLFVPNCRLRKIAGSPVFAVVMLEISRSCSPLMPSCR